MPISQATYDTVPPLQSVGLSPEEIDILTSTEHRPNYCLQVMSEVLSNNDTFTDFQRINIVSKQS